MCSDTSNGSQSTSRGEPQIPAYYGLALFENDVLAHLVPGLFLLLSLRVLRGILGIPKPQWEYSLPVWDSWWSGLVAVGAMVLTGYVIGLVVDALIGWRLADWFARAQHRSEWNTTSLESMSWRQAVDIYLQRPPSRNEYIQVFRAQAQTRSLANLGMLCVATMLCLAAFLRLLHGTAWPTVLVVAISGVIACCALLLGSYNRARRRVLGVHQAYRIGNRAQDPISPNQKAKASRCRGPWGRLAQFVLGVASFVLFLLFIGIIVLVHVAP